MVDDPVLIVEQAIAAEADTAVDAVVVVFPSSAGSGHLLGDLVTRNVTAGCCGTRRNSGARACSL